LFIGNIKITFLTMADNKQDTKSETQETKGVATTKEQFQALINSLKQLDASLRAIGDVANECKDTATTERLFSDTSLADALHRVQQALICGELELADWDKLQTKTYNERLKHIRNRAFINLFELLAQGLREHTEGPPAETGSAKPGESTDQAEESEEEECCGCCED
jgi:chaperonin cofactor prefoldin